MKTNNTIFILTIYAIILIFITYGLINKQNKIGKPISLPEEIQAAQKNDTLYITNVSDSIYVGFKK